ncbi:P-loop containing nucleoside triphosphate hydrolases superfamily protein [Perilla frutescens var. hirtella]|nr:P-loop containing nucleoside triphosphate hydrolases superfamily protein [Perilla frutescens var. hirtella]
MGQLKRIVLLRRIVESGSQINLGGFLVLVVGVPNVGKSALINCIHQIASSRFPVQGKKKRATVGPLPGVTQDIAGFKIAHQPSIYVLDTPGVLVPSIPDVETGLKLTAAGSVKDSVVGEERIAQYLLAVLFIGGDLWDVVTRVQGALCETLSEFNGNLEEEGDLEDLIDQQFEALQKALKIPHKASEARKMVSKKFLTLFRMGKLGPFILDDVPDQ